jgi:prepilin-type processing-associated H-X9-DG protein
LDVGKAQLSVQRKGYTWMHGELGRTLYNHCLGVNDHTCTNGGLVQHGAWTAGSLHSGGANVVFVDGHVSFIRQEMDLSVWHAIGSMDGNEIVNGSP